MNKETLGNKIERIITEQDKYNWRKEMEFDFEDEISPIGLIVLKASYVLLFIGLILFAILISNFFGWISIPDILAKILLVPFCICVPTGVALSTSLL